MARLDAVTQYLQLILTNAPSTRYATLMPRLLAEVAHIAELQAIFYDALVQPRRDTLEAILRRAIERGEIRADTDVELAIDVLAGPMIYKLIITGGDLEQVAPMPPRVLALVLEGLRPR